MAVPITPTTEIAVSQSGTSPIMLIELGYDPIIRLCTAGTINSGGEDWTATDAKVNNIRNTQGGGQTALLVFPNLDGVFGALMLNDKPRGKSIRAWLMYGTDFADAVLKFSGVMDNLKDFGTPINIPLMSERIAESKTPRLTLGMFIDDVIAPGTQFLWDSVIYIVRARN